MKRIPILIFFALSALIFAKEDFDIVQPAPDAAKDSPTKMLLAKPANEAVSPSKALLKSAGVSNSASSSQMLSLSPGPVGGLGGFLSSIGSTGHSLSFSVASNGKNTGYNAMYSHNLFYDMGKYGRLDMNIGAGKAGDYKSAAYLYLAPSVDYRLQSDNFLLNVHVDVPPAVKKQSFGR